VRQGDCASAERAVNEAGGSETHAFLALVRAALLLEQESARRGADLSRDLLQRYPQGLYLEPSLGARILLALALFRQHQANLARQMMASAVRLAYPEGLLRPFLDYGRSGAPLLTLVLQTSNLTVEARFLC